jgi:hypothetical protein
MTFAVEVENLALKVPTFAHSESSARCRLDTKQAEISQ